MEGLLSRLKFLADYYKSIGDNWRSSSYYNVIYILSDRDFTPDLYLTKIAGIGKSIRDKISEYFKTGEISLVLQIQKEEIKKLKCLKLFQKIWGIGPVKANQLYNLGITGISQLKKNKYYLNRSQLLGLKYYTDLNKRLSRDFIDSFKDELSKRLRDYKFEICGSYRRMSLDSGDIDLVIQGDVSILYNLEDIILETLSIKNEKFMGIAKFNNSIFRLDIEFVSQEEYITTLLYFTGSKKFNIFMRSHAKKLGYKLNQHGLYNSIGERIHIHHEYEIFDILKLDFLLPKDR